MNVVIIRIPYDSGHRAFRTGRGPDYLNAPFVKQLTEGGHSVESTAIEAQAFPPTEVSTMFELYRELAVRVERAIASARFPLVLAGNCNCIVGTLGGLGSEPVAHMFFDGHGDFNTPETTTTGFLDGMGLAMATGRCWNALTASIAGFTPLPETRAALVGARDIDELEEKALVASELSWISARAIREAGAGTAIAPTLERFRSDVDRIYLHFDMDVLDPKVARANRLSPPDGLRLDELREIVRAVRERFSVVAVSFASIEPGCDDDGKTLEASLAVMDEVLG